MTVRWASRKKSPMFVGNRWVAGVRARCRWGSAVAERTRSGGPMSDNTSGKSRVSAGAPLAGFRIFGEGLRDLLPHTRGRFVRRSQH